jgi:DNA-directed RNA polymerase specialized sigma24 family protein
MASDLPPFGPLIEQHGPILLRYLRRLDNPEAEDLFQETVLKALRSYRGLSRATNLRSWLFAVATSVARDAARRSARRPPGLPLDSVAVPSAESRPGYSIEYLVAPLTPRQREAVVARYVDDMPYAEIGRRLGCSEAAARTRVAGAIRRLRRALKQEK